MRIYIYCKVGICICLQFPFELIIWSGYSNDSYFCLTRAFYCLKVSFVINVNFCALLEVEAINKPLYYISIFELCLSNLRPPPEAVVKKVAVSQKVRSRNFSLAHRLDISTTEAYVAFRSPLDRFNCVIILKLYHWPLNRFKRVTQSI